MRSLFKNWKGYGGWAIMTPILVVFEVAIEVSIPFIISRIIDIGIQGEGGVPYVLKWGGIMLALALVALILGGLAGRTCAVASMGFAKNLRNNLFAKVQEFSFGNIDKFSTPSLITRMTTDVTNTQMAFMMSLRLLVRCPMMLICATLFAININLKLSVVFLVVIPFLIVAAGVLLSIAYPRFIKLLKRYDVLNASVQENLTAIRVVKTFVREDHESEKFKAASDDLMNMGKKAENVMVVAMPLMMSAVYACILSILWFGGNLIAGGNMTTGELTSFLGYIMQILMSLMLLAMLFVMVVISRASMTRIIEVLDEQPDITDHDAISDLAVADGSVQFCDVNFSYKKDAENFALSGITLAINSGETVGIIGGTGTSKTTLIQLISRLYDVTEGEVLVGGRNVKDYKIHTLRDAVATVLQKNVLFSGTIKENLRWGKEDATDEEIYEVCKIAAAYDFVTEFPNGFDTHLGQGGVNVSGGQKQRLCIARALLKKPKILILDDSTSAVDTKTDLKIRTALRTYCKGMTTVIIAQRIASVMDADKIILMEDGRVSDVGRHEELLSRSEIYRDVYRSQTNREVSNA